MMPLERRPISVSQLAELLGVDQARFMAIERHCSKTDTGWYVVTEAENEMVQTSGTCPPLSDNTARKPTRKKGKK